MKCACFPKGLEEMFKIICGLKLQQISMSCLISTKYIHVLYVLFSSCFYARPVLSRATHNMNLSAIPNWS